MESDSEVERRPDSVDHDPRQTPGVERVGARQPAGAGRVHRGHADAARRVIVIVRRVRGVPIAPGCGRLLHRNHRSAVRRFARAAAPAIEHHPVQPIAVRAAATRPPRSQVGLDDLPQHDSVFFSVRGNRFDVIGLAGCGLGTMENRCVLGLNLPGAHPQIEIERSVIFPRSRTGPQHTVHGGPPVVGLAAQCCGESGTGSR